MSDPPLLGRSSIVRATSPDGYFEEGRVLEIDGNLVRVGYDSYAVVWPREVFEFDVEAGIWRPTGQEHGEGDAGPN